MVFTDHKLLVGALHLRSDLWSARQQRHLSFIARFAPTLRHIAGESKITAYTLSRPAGDFSSPALAVQDEEDVGAFAIAVFPPTLPVNLAAAQASCSHFQQASTLSSLHVFEVFKVPPPS